MSPECKAIEAALALEGRSILDRDPQIAAHVETCDHCLATLEALDDLDQLLGQLPAIEPPTTAVDRLLDHPELAVATTPPNDRAQSSETAEPERATAAERLEPAARPRPWRSRWAYASAAVAALLGLAVGALLLRPLATEDLSFSLAGAPLEPARQDDSELDGTGEAKSGDRLRALGYVGSDSATPRDQDSEANSERSNAEESLVLDSEVLPSTNDQPGPDSRQIPKPSTKSGVVKKSRPKSKLEQKTAEVVIEDEGEVVGELPVISHSSASSYDQQPTPSARELQAQLLGRAMREETLGPRAGSFDDSIATDSPAEVDKLAPAAAPAAPIGGRLDEALSRSTKEDLRPSTPQLAARAFLEGLRHTEGLEFLPATGLWSNSYLPGDPQLRLRRARLEGWDRSALAATTQASWTLHDTVQTSRHPFDPPRQSAMALYVNADQRRIEGESRVLLQVGLRATDRRGGQRPAMNLGVVLDFAQAPTTEQLDSLRALLFALDEARQPGDRFHLLTSLGDAVLEPEEFRRGRLRLFLADLTVGDNGDNGDDSSAALRGALERTTDRVVRGDDPAAPWGSSSLLLITDRWLGGERNLQDLARRNAVAGLALSTIALGDAEQAAELDELTLAGQGRRWWLRDPVHAVEVARREIDAVAQTVARALRLNIRLAAGVQLVGVFDSQPLDTVRAEQVRQAERAIDLRLARNLGIATDRTADDEGLQIVIPAFQAGDAHTVLLDLVVSGPGKVAEVTLRYKDLVRLGNGTVREQLSLRRGQRAPGPLELSVLRNRLEIELAEGLGQAADILLDRGPEAATARLIKLRDLWLGLPVEVPGLAASREIDSDLALIDDYLAALATAQAEAQDWQLSESLRYAGQLALRPPPPPIQPD